MFKNKKGFTLIELLVVVLIIGILTAIAVPKYQKSIYKSRLFKGVSMVESLFQAEQAYFLANSKFAEDIDELDLSLPLNESCVKTQSKYQSSYKCDFGTIGSWSGQADVQFQAKPSYNAYSHFLQNYNHSAVGLMKAGERWCFAHPKENHPSRQICVDMGGEEKATDKYWSYYKLK